MGHHGQPHHVFFFSPLQCPVANGVLSSLGQSGALAGRARKDAATRGKHGGVHRAGWGKRGFRGPRRCTIEGAVGKTTGNGGKTAGGVRAVRCRLRRGAGAAKRPAGRRGVGGKNAIGASNLSSERSKNDAKSDSYRSSSSALKVEPATTDRKFATSGTSGSPYFGTCPPQTPTVANSTAPQLHMAPAPPPAPPHCQPSAYALGPSPPRTLTTPSGIACPWQAGGRVRQRWAARPLTNSRPKFAHPAKSKM